MTYLMVVLCIASFTLFSAEIIISPGTSAKAVANQLVKQGVIQRPTLFYLYLKATNQTSKIHAGQFTIAPNASFEDIANIITGKTPQWIKVTIPEGFTLNEIVHRLELKGIISSANEFSDFLKRKKNTPINDYLMPAPVAGFEGLFFPDTYHFSKNMSFEQVYQSFIQAFNRTLFSAYKAKKNPRLGFYDTLILASIIEKEAGTVSEMPLISGVFHHRLRKNMYLASCPTVGYAMGEPRKKSLTYKDLDTVSPFNTYRHRGLPPSPIASPGKKAFMAALNPMNTPYLYFVAKNDGSGTHVFSTNLKDHLNNQKKILRNQK
jgi:UPF0755 protein